MRHLSELYLDVESELFAEVSSCRVQLIVSNLENCATVLSATRSIVLQSQPGDDTEDFGLFDRNSDATVASLRTAKVIAGKLLHVVRDMRSRNLSLGIETLPHFDKSNELASQIFELLRSVGSAVDKVSQDDDDSDLDFLEVYNTIRQATENTMGSGKTDLFYETQKLTRALHDLLNDLNGLASDLAQLVEFEKPSPPWVVRSRELQDSKVISAGAEEEIKTLKRENQERATKIKLQNEKIEEAKMKNELLERRNKDANKKLDHIVELESKMSLATQRENQLETALETSRQAIQKLEDERDRWMQRASEAKAIPSADDAGQKERLVGSAGEMDVLKTSLDALRSANTYLRKQAWRGAVARDTAENGWLLTPLKTGAVAPAPADEREAAGARAVLRNIAALPAVARPLRLADRAAEARAAFRLTPRYRLIDEEARWLKAWGPAGERWEGGPRVVGVDVAE
jgi:dynactin 1